MSQFQKPVDKISCSLSLMRRLPPNKIEQNLSGLLNLVPEETDELLQRVDQPLEEKVDPDTVSWWLIFPNFFEFIYIYI